jgi:hypothetical protein
MRAKIYKKQHHARDWQLNVQMTFTEMLLLPLSLVKIQMKKARTQMKFR